MFSWLFRLFEQAPAPSPVHGVAEPAYRVRNDEQAIVVTTPAQARSEISWAQIETVHVRTMIGGAWAADVFWVLRGKRQKVVVPFGAYGESNLVKAMQERLPGFDKMAVIEALSSTGEGEIQVWPADQDLQF